uniref:TPR_REGION domain-containing protein n=1 Tax=Panagrellus redivivus TaxID=6233 RepID=A0A7E4W1I9_PANRE
MVSANEIGRTVTIDRRKTTLFQPPEGRTGFEGRFSSMPENVYDDICDTSSCNTSKSGETSTLQSASLSCPSTSDIIVEEFHLLGLLIERAATSYSSGDLQDSLNHYDQAVLIDPNNNVLYANRSAILLKLGRVQEAIAEATHAIQLKPEWPKAYFRKAEALKEAKEFEKAIVCYCQAITANSGSQHFLTSMVNCVRGSKIKDGFEAAYKQMKGLDLDKSPFVIMSVIGQEFLNVGNALAAIAVLKHAISVDSPSLKLKESAIGALARAYYDANNLQKTIDYLEMQLELVVELGDVRAQLEVHQNIANIAIFLKDRQLAVIHCDEQIALLCKLGESTTRGLIAKGKVYLQFNDLTEAEQNFRLVLSENDTDHDANLLLGDTLFKLGNYAEATQAYDKACVNATTADDKLTALMSMCQSMLAQGKTESVIHILKECLKTGKLKHDATAFGGVLSLLCKAAEASGDLINLYRMAKRQLKYSITAGDVSLKAEAFYYLSVFYDLTNYKSNAIRLLHLYIEAIEGLEISQKGQRQVNALKRLSKLQFDTGNWEAALETTQKQLELSTKFTDVTNVALAHSQLCEIYRQMQNKESRQHHLNKLKELSLSTLEVDSLQISAICDTAFGQLYVDDANWAVAKKLLERALIIVQEMGDAEKEAYLCKQLGIIHLKMDQTESAIVYVNQYLMISQQKRQPAAMSEAYELLCQAYVKLESWDDAHDCAKFHLTLSGLIECPQQKLTALLTLGKIFIKKCEFQTAVKVLLKVKSLGEQLNAKPELAVCFGYLGECYLKLNRKEKALSHFCNQLSYFPYIKDVQAKCDTIQHLIEEKTLANDIIWCAKLCYLREEISQEGTYEIQINVHRETAAKMEQLGCFGEATKSLEKALVLSIQHEHYDTVTILLKLCELYQETQQYQKAIVTLTEFVALQDDLCGPDVYYQLSIMLLMQNEIEGCLQNLKKCKQFDMVDNRYMYAFACAFCYERKYNDAYYWLSQYMESTNGEGILHEKLLWERCIVDYLRSNNIGSIEDELELLLRASTIDYSFYLDKFNLYKMLNDSHVAYLPPLAKLHYQMETCDYIKAELDLRVFDPVNVALEKAALEILNHTLTGINLPEVLFKQTTIYSTPAIFVSAQSEYEKALTAISAVNALNTSVIDALQCVEYYHWACMRKEIAQTKYACATIPPTTNDVRDSVDKLPEMLCSFVCDGMTIVWRKELYCDLRMYYVLTESKEKLSKFYVNLCIKVLRTSMLEEISADTLKSWQESAVFVVGDIEATETQDRCFSLVDFCQQKQRVIHETKLLIANSKPINNYPNESVILNLHTNNMTTDMLSFYLSQSAIVYFDQNVLLPDILNPLDLYSHQLNTSLVIIDTESLTPTILTVTRHLIALGCQWVVTTSFGPQVLEKITPLISTTNQIGLNVSSVKKSVKGLDCRFFCASGADSCFQVSGLCQAVRNAIATGMDRDAISHNAIENGFSEEFTEALIRRVTTLQPVRDELAKTSRLTDLLMFSIQPSSIECAKQFLEPLADLEASRLLFVDFLPPQLETSKRLDTVDAVQLMKTFDVRNKWRRKRKTKNTQSVSCVREYASDGERFAGFSDKDMTDTESISGARVLGIDLLSANECDCFE